MNEDLKRKILDWYNDTKKEKKQGERAVGRKTPTAKSKLRVKGRLT